MLVLGLAGPHLAQAQAPHALVLDVNGIINPVKHRFIARAIEQAQLDQATVVVIQLDTPGGLLSSTRKIVEELLSAPVPVAVYVSPRGARAGSAGTFITAAAHFAVMAPGTNIGAATPVSSTGEDIPETLASKVENDVAALIRSIAQERGRNEDKLEETVRKAASFTAKEAVELNVVDFIADDLDALLARIHGEEVETPSGPRTLDTRDVEQRRFKKNLLENFLEIISDPNVSFILLTLGGLGLVIELFNPGLIAPGVVGVIALLLAYGLVSWAFGSWMRGSVSYFPSATPLWIPQAILALGPVVLALSLISRLIRLATGEEGS
ncbi:MAG: ATP-dependent Clp protease proteolytic subunit [Proteobacteria bacterium]|nr:ATP-dependent Clp protease proteolytic subunit [Pseudomonadota bacterium]